MPIWRRISLAPLDRIVLLGGVAVKGGAAVSFTLDGLASQALSLLTLSKRNPTAGFDGLLIDLEKNTIAEVQKERPIIFFKETYDVEFLYFLAIKNRPFWAVFWWSVLDSNQ